MKCSSYLSILIILEVSFGISILLNTRHILKSYFGVYYHQIISHLLENQTDISIMMYKCLIWKVFKIG